MSAILKKFFVLAVFAVLLLPLQVHADVAPDPITRSISYLPIVLVILLVLAVLFILKRFYKK